MVGQTPSCGTGDSELMLDEEKLIALNKEIKDSGINVNTELVKQASDVKLEELFESDEYCFDNKGIGFNLSSIVGDNVDLDDAV